MDDAGSFVKREIVAPPVALPKKQASSTGNFSHVAKNTANGFVTVSVYFADVVSDVQVLVLLYESGNTAWAHIALFFLIAQFFAIYIRVLPYLHSTFGATSPIYLSYLWCGFPIGATAHAMRYAQPPPAHAQPPPSACPTCPCPSPSACPL